MGDSEDSSSCLTSSSITPAPLWLVNGGFIPVILGIASMFWGITFVCEEFAVPAIAVFCKRNRFSDSLTGSIFIGTGLSLPVFFVAIAGLFASNSAIGVGAVVGGNLFNHLITIPSTIYICPNKSMKLDGFVFSREMFLYFTSCLLVLWTLKTQGDYSSAFSKAFSSAEWRRCLSIPWYASLALVVAYVLYCFIDGNFYLIEELVAHYYHGQDHNVSSPAESQGSQKAQDEKNKKKTGSSCCGGLNSSTTSVVLMEDITVEKSCTLASLEEDHVNTFINFAVIESQQTQQSTQSERREADLEQNVLTNDSNVDNKEKSVKMLLEENLEEIVKAKSMMESVFDQDDNYLRILSMPMSLRATKEDEQNGEAEMNSNKTMILRMNQSFFILTFPLRYLLYLTIPDVRRPGNESKAILSMSAVILWLAIMSYILTVALTLIGNWWHLSGAVMGITVAAWASNFPAHWSSMIVSVHGYGDISCCNCLGSNIFNNLIGLGLPWLLYNISHAGQSYEMLEDDGVAISIFLMMITIVIHYVMVWWSNWTLSVWMIVPMVTMYAVCIGFLCYFYTVMV